MMKNSICLEPYKYTGSFRFWCQKVLPLVYDDSLSYYELLCKVVSYLNDVIANVDGLKIDIDKIIDAFNALQNYVNNYFNDLDVQDEINNKLDQMAQDGTLDEIINKKIFNKLNVKIDRMPFNPDEKNKIGFQNAVADCVASYLASGVNLDSVIGNSNITPKVAYVYSDGTKGYMGVLGQGDDMVYTDTTVINDVEYPVAYIDCSQFLSLLTKCRNFENSPFKYAFENKNNINKVTLREKCLEFGGLDGESYTFDFFNYIYSARMAYIMNSSGNRVRLVSKKTNAGDCELTDYIDELEDGDLIFVGNPIQFPKRYMNQHHVGIYFKTLDPLNKAGEKYGVSFKDIDEGYQSQYGYFVHATGTTGLSANTLRINTLYSYANTLPANGTRLVYSCKPYANALNSNKAFRAISYLFSEYNRTGFGYRSGNYNYIRTSEESIGRWVIQQLTYNGAVMPSGQNLDVLDDGFYYVNTQALRDSLSNIPKFVGVYFDVITMGTGAGSQRGLQIAISSYGEIAYRKKQFDSEKWQKWAVVSAINKLQHGVENFGTITAGGKKTQHIDFDNVFTAIPHVVCSLRCDNSWGVNVLSKLGISAYNVTVDGFDLTVVNGSESSLVIRGDWVAK